MVPVSCVLPSWTPTDLLGGGHPLQRGSPAIPLQLVFLPHLVLLPVSWALEGVVEAFCSVITVWLVGICWILGDMGPVWGMWGWWLHICCSDILLKWAAKVCMISPYSLHEQSGILTIYPTVIIAIDITVPHLQTASTAIVVLFVLSSHAFNVRGKFGLLVQHWSAIMFSVHYLSTILT